MTRTPLLRAPRAGLTGLLAAALALSTPSAIAAPPDAAGRTAPASGAAAAPAATGPSTSAVPRLAVGTVASGLTNPWDVAELPSRRLLVTERDSGRVILVGANGAKRTVSMRNPVWSSGETGLMSLVLDPDFASTRRFYTCQGGTRSNGGHDVRVVRWKLSGDERSASAERTILAGLPATSGRHGGCRLLFNTRTSLLVGTGDAAVGTNPRDLDSLGGKVLRIDRSGRAWPGNPWAKSERPRRFVLTYGHRNVQGLARRPADGSLWSAEHGPDRDDEVNRLVSRGDYGWNPVPGYNESVPMTDDSLPGTQQAARWRSGASTIATSGATFVSGGRWGTLNGALAVAALKGEQVLFMKVASNGTMRPVARPAELTRFGRLRSVTRTASGDLLVTTSNGGGDRVLRVSPR